jgi:DNA-binding response OmpR family regulator
LREKVEVDPARPRRIVTVWGVGYRYEGSTGA